MKPWNAEDAAGKITRPLRHNSQPYSGINILMLWASAMEQGFAAPIWMTFKQALELNAHVRKGERGSLVVYANADSKPTSVERIERAEEFFSHIPVTLKHGGNRAYYEQELDYVQLPVIEAFRDAESYYATLGHEFIHATKHP